MSTVIEITPLSGRQSKGFAHLQLFHSGCQQIPLVKHRNPVKQQYTLQCVCSLTIRLPAEGAAVEAFDLTAADQQPRTVPSDSYSSNIEGELKLSARRVS